MGRKYIDFYIMRHSNAYNNMKIQDPHLSPDGIKNIYKIKKKIIKNKYEIVFVSPLIRTWETGICIMSNKKRNINDIKADKTGIYIGGYLREFNINALYNTPYSYKKNSDRLKKFKRYIRKEE